MSIQRRKKRKTNWLIAYLLVVMLVHRHCIKMRSNANFCCCFFLSISIDFRSSNVIFLWFFPFLVAVSIRAIVSVHAFWYIYVVSIKAAIFAMAIEWHKRKNCLVFVEKTINHKTKPIQIVRYKCNQLQFDIHIQFFDWVFGVLWDCFQWFKNYSIYDSVLISNQS